MSISRAQRVSATVALDMPARVTMSPAAASSMAVLRQAAEGEDLGDPELFEALAVAGQGLDRARRSCTLAGFDAAGQDAADEGVGGERGGEHAERLGRCGDAGSGRGRGRRSGRRARRGSCAGRRGWCRPSRRGPRRRGAGSRAGRRSAPRLANRSKTSFRARSGSASCLSTLFSTTIGRRPRAQRLGGDELGLRHRAFGGVDQQDDAVDHATGCVRPRRRNRRGRGCRRC